MRQETIHFIFCKTKYKLSSEHIDNDNVQPYDNTNIFWLHYQGSINVIVNMI